MSCRGRPKAGTTASPSSDDNATAANSCSDCSRAVVVDEATMPSHPAKKGSPTIAPITDSPAAMRQPEKMAAARPGNCSFNSRWLRVARWSVNRVGVSDRST